MTVALPLVAAPESGWRHQLTALVATTMLLLALFARDAAAIVATWWTSTTFGHCFVVAALLGWLVAQRRRELAALVPVAWPWGLIAVAAGGATWLVGQAGAVTALREFGVLAMAEGAVLTLLGPFVARGLAFPLGYALFLVPFGEWLEAPLQALTVRLATPLLALAGVPATSNGVMIQAGRYYFEVAEACSGAKFVIAMVALGVLVGHLCYTRWSRRIAFLAACVVVPVLANGVRAAMTMWLADRLGIQVARGIDHIVYGWLWFGVVMAATLAIGWRWFDRPVDAPAFDPARLAGCPRRTLPAATAAALVLVTAGGFAAWGAAATARTTALPDRLDLPAVTGWHRVPLGTRSRWRPDYPGADHVLIGRYANRGGDRVDVAVAVYAGQTEGRSLVAYGTGALGDGPWLRVADLAPIAGASAMRIVAPGPVERIVTTRYRIGEVATSNPVAVKLATLRAHLFGGSQRATAIHLSAEVVPGRDPVAAIARLAAALPADPTVSR